MSTELGGAPASAAPQLGEAVLFRCAQDHRCPRIGRAGYYEPGQDYSEIWTRQHCARHREGALILVSPQAPESTP